MTTPFVCVLIAFVLIYLPKIPLSVAMAKEGAGYDNNNPREQQARLTGWAARARAAHMNAFESFPAFAAAVIIAHLAKADPAWSAKLAIAHVVARTFYPFIYMANVGALRSLVWGVGFVATIGLFVLPLL